MSKKTQSQKIEELMERCMETMTDKEKIYDKVEEELGVPRPTIRRVARDLRIKYEKRIECLVSEGTKLVDKIEAEENEL